MTFLSWICLLWLSSTKAGPTVQHTTASQSNVSPFLTGSPNLSLIYGKCSLLVSNRWREGSVYLYKFSIPQRDDFSITSKSSFAMKERGILWVKWLAQMSVFQILDKYVFVSSNGALATTQGEIGKILQNELYLHGTELLNRFILFSKLFAIILKTSKERHFRPNRWGSVQNSQVLTYKMFQVIFL